MGLNLLLEKKFESKAYEKAFHSHRRKEVDVVSERRRRRHQKRRDPKNFRHFHPIFLLL